MNRLILVGNGFDLAHGLKTSYKDFIDDFWEEQINTLKTSSNHFNFENNFFKIYKNWKSMGLINNYFDLSKTFNISSINSNFIFKNRFLETISEKGNLQNWVDIENEYYQLLKKIEAFGVQTYSNIEDLNSDFEEIKKIFEDYLNKIDKKFDLKKIIIEKLSSNLFLKDLTSQYQNEIAKLIFNNCKSFASFEGSKYFNEMKPNLRSFIQNVNNSNSLERNNYIIENFDNLGLDKTQIINLYPTETLILNFNYTNTTQDYIHEFNESNEKFVDYNISENHIHGELNNPENPIIFGFGDDVDKKYQEIENLNDNRYLKNFKSIAYLQTDNYKKLLEFIDSEEYQIFIFGHSCGISDRTMLNTIFEHDNCKSIKPFYHKREDGTDNYTEIVQNISRNFNNKKKYRDRVVNKTYCEPLS